MKITDLLKKWQFWLFANIFILIMTWFWFSGGGFIPAGIVEPDSWLAFWGGFLAFVGTTSLGVVAVWQNNKANDTNKRILYQADEHRKISAMLAEQRRKLDKMREAYKKYITLSDVVYGVSMPSFYAKLIKEDAWTDKDEIAYTNYMRNLNSQLGEAAADLHLAANLIPECSSELSAIFQVKEAVIKYLVHLGGYGDMKKSIKSPDEVEENYKEFFSEADKLREQCHKLHGKLSLAFLKNIYTVEQAYQNAIYKTDNPIHLAKLFGNENNSKDKMEGKENGK